MANETSIVRLRTIAEVVSAQGDEGIAQLIYYAAALLEREHHLSEEDVSEAICKAAVPAACAICSEKPGAVLMCPECFTEASRRFVSAMLEESEEPEVAPPPPTET